MSDTTGSTEQNPEPTNLDLELAEAKKYLAYQTFLTAKAAANDPGSNEIDREVLAQAMYDYLVAQIPDNENFYVPWSDASRPFLCPTCGDTINARQKHSHSEDELFIVESALALS